VAAYQGLIQFQLSRSYVGGDAGMSDAGGCLIFVGYILLLPGLCSAISISFLRAPVGQCWWTQDEFFCGLTQDPQMLGVGLLMGAVGVALITWAIRRMRRS
jgi:hypothetical protein